MRGLKRLLLLFIVIVFMTGCSDNKKYNVTFMYDGKVVEIKTIDKNEIVVDFPDINTISEKVGYEFNGWDYNGELITKDSIINAILKKKVFDVSFYDNETLIDAQKVEYGDDALEIDSSKLSIKEGYTFVGWDKDITNITDNVITHAIYQKKSFEVKFLDEEGSQLETVNVLYGEKANLENLPKKAGYKFVGWDKDISSVKEDLVVSPIFEIIDYTITYLDENGKVIENLQPSTYNILSSASIDLPGAIEKDGFKFLGWYSGSTRVVTFFSSDLENKTYKAKYQELEKDLEIPDDMKFMFTNIKKVEHSTQKGTYVYQPDFANLDVPSKSVSAWQWSSLNTGVATISQWSSISSVSTGYAIIKAVYSQDTSIIGYAVIKISPDGITISSLEEANNKQKHLVTFLDFDKKVIETQEVVNGKSAVYPIPPIKEGYTFVGWSKDAFGIEMATTIEANYIVGGYNFVGKKVSILGDSISTFNGYIPETYSYFYPCPTAEFADVNQTWWMQVVNNLGMKLLKNNSWSGSCVSSGTGKSSAVEDSRLKELVDENQTPDVIIIYMGTNDCASQFVNINTFKSSYKVMLDKIKSLCPNAEIYIANIVASGLVKETERTKYNDIISEYAKEYNYPLIDLTDLFTVENYKQYVVDSCHPNKSGMDMMAREITKQMLKHNGVVLK